MTTSSDAENEKQVAGDARERELQTREQEITRRENVLNTAPLRRNAVASTRASMTIGPRWRSAARIIGIACFLLGALLLLYVFRQAIKGFENFSRPDYLSLQMRRVQGDGFAEAILAGIIVIGTEFMRLGYLLVLGFLGSIVAAKGIQFFAASESVIDEALDGDNS